MKSFATREKHQAPPERGPEYKLENAALGVYTDGLEIDYLTTVAAFRDEFRRIEASAEQARIVAELEAIEVKYPEKIVAAKA